MHVDSPSGAIKVEVDCNTPDVRLFDNVAKNATRGLDEVCIAKPSATPALIVGGGPSIADELPKIRDMQARGWPVFALNNAAKFLHDFGIMPDYQIILDAREANVGFIGPHARHLLLASQCAPIMFDRAAEIGIPVTLWHPLIEGLGQHIPNKRACFIGGGTTVGLSGLCLVHTLGHREIHLFGYDSSHRFNKGHAYDQPMNATDEVVTVSVNSRRFQASITMAAQVAKFKELAAHLSELGTSLHLYGDGLLQTVWREMQRRASQRVLSAVYDLGSSPPTYDFISFLGEAEKARIEGGFDVLDVYFQPGPMRGFRDDALPPSPEKRECMLHRICVPACRLLPSVRHVAILREREPVEGDVFPKEWAIDVPISHYGTQHFRSALPCLRATDWARAKVGKDFAGKYVTITVRESEYWPQRNSNLVAWAQVADWLRGRGYEVVWVPDTESHGRGYAPAAFDIDIRMALYEGAALNLGVSNGPMALFLYSSVPYILFRLLDETTPATTAAFWRKCGVEPGTNLTRNGVCVWEPDDYEVIVNAVTQFLEDRQACLQAM